MRYLSVCSGIEAATVAWHDLGWKPEAFSEIEKFPSQVLNHRYPEVPNLGDMTKYKEWKLNESIDILVGGTPCQSFSIAGLRQGLNDPRGNLMLTYLGIADKFKPKWIVWENVPGVLSSNGGRDFGSFLGALVELGYGFAYRVLDAQNFGVAQRRRRVFVVGCLGDWRSAAEVLFESESLRGDIKKSRKKGEDTPTSFVPSTCGTLPARDYKGLNSFSDVSSGKAVVSTTVYENHPADSRVTEMGETCSTVAARWGTGGGNVPFAVAHGFLPTQRAKAGNIGYVEEQAPTLRAGCDAYGLLHHMAVRRLTPVECERLQGFPDGYTDIQLNGKQTPDSGRYKALGNSMAVPVMAWIGKRIQRLEEI
jgi:DNA (cytosine-5)-methyltransferase 1